MGWCCSSGLEVDTTKANQNPAEATRRETRTNHRDPHSSASIWVRAESEGQAKSLLTRKNCEKVGQKPEKKQTCGKVPLTLY